LATTLLLPLPTLVFSGSVHTGDELGRRSARRATVKVVVARVADFDPGTRRIVKVGGRSIGVFRVGDRYFAVRNRCPHQGGPLAAGRVFRRMLADGPGQVRLDSSMLISCPWHGWQWDMETGEAYAPDDPRVRSYPVTVEPGERVACALQTAADREEPFVAETYEVRVEEDYVVLDA
jgi:3-phenylpropionate/trans-cinnamate dioxygenase ferredoxin subunit